MAVLPAGGAAQTDRPFAGDEHLVHRVLLVRSQPIGRQERVIGRNFTIDSQSRGGSGWARIAF